jgi:hypothetical protein
VPGAPAGRDAPRPLHILTHLRPKLRATGLNQLTTLAHRAWKSGKNKTLPDSHIPTVWHSDLEHSVQGR